MAPFGSAGLCYGILVGNLPRPETIFKPLLNQYQLKSIRLYSPDSSILDLLKAKGSVSVMLGVPDEELKELSGNPDYANNWVETNVEPYANIIKYIVVGNDVDPSSTPADVFKNLHPAMVALKDAIVAFGHGEKIIVSTALGSGILVGGDNPSQNSFNSTYLNFLDPILKFLVKNKAPLLFNVHPYHRIADNPKARIDYATFVASGTVVQDGPYEYQNMFDAIVDSLIWALEGVSDDAGNLKIVVSESGWPTDGGRFADKNHASTYISNLISHLGKGTPKRSGEAMETYILALFDENNKPGSKYDKHWGTFDANGKPKYSITPAK